MSNSEKKPIFSQWKDKKSDPDGSEDNWKQMFEVAVQTALNQQA